MDLSVGARVNCVEGACEGEGGSLEEPGLTEPLDCRRDVLRERKEKGTEEEATRSYTIECAGAAFPWAMSFTVAQNEVTSLVGEMCGFPLCNSVCQT